MTMPEQSAQLQSIALLQEAFARFNETGKALRDKYEELQNEAAELRETLKQKEIEIKRNERLAMLGNTAAAIAHEIRNPLGAMKLFLSMLQDDLADRPECLKIIAHLHTSVERLDGTVGNILQFARQKDVACAPFNLHSVIQEQIEYFKTVEPAEMKLELSLKGNAFVNGNEDGIRRAIYNLILNATQALRHRGVINVATRCTDYGTEIRVSDNGPGIPEQILGSLFEPFVTSRKDGTGLGLAIVRQIVEQHGGTISVASEHGATFLMVLPHSKSEKGTDA